MQKSVTVMSQCDLSEQENNIFKVKEYTSKNQRCLKQISVPKNTAGQIKPSEISDKSRIETTTNYSLNSKSDMTECTHIINVFQELFQ